MLAIMLKGAHIGGFVQQQGACPAPLGARSPASLMAERALRRTVCCGRARSLAALPSPLSIISSAAGHRDALVVMTLALQPAPATP